MIGIWQGSTGDPSKVLKRLPSQWLVLLIIQLALLSCASGRPAVYFHSFSFDMHIDSPDMEVLDYQYGSNRQDGTFMPKGMVKRGVFIKQHSTSGFKPRGEFLYVKWRSKSTGQVYEDRVDLMDRLPADMTNYTVTFFMKGPQLYVYLISPEEDRRPASWPKGPMRMYDHLKEYQLYPGQPDLRFLDSNNTTTSGR